MRVATYYSNRDVRLEEMPIPEIGAGEVLMRVEAAASVAATCSSGTVRTRRPWSSVTRWQVW